MQASSVMSVKQGGGGDWGRGEQWDCGQGSRIVNSTCSFRFASLQVAWRQQQWCPGAAAISGLGAEGGRQRVQWLVLARSQRLKHQW